MVKFTYVYFIIETKNVNHTALFNAAKECQDLKADNFRRMFYTDKSQTHRHDRYLNTREYEEVLVRCSAVLFRLDINFIDYKSRRNHTRYAVIFRKIFKEDEKNQAQAIQSMNIFIKKYQRVPIDIKVCSGEKLPTTI